MAETSTPATGRVAEAGPGWILVTGGASGIGLAVATMLVRQSRNVVILDRDAEAGHAAAGMFGRSCLFVEGDVTERDAVDLAIAHGQQRFGRLAGASNNAGVPRVGKALTDLEDADWDRILDVNLRSIFLCMRAEIQAMRGHGGAIVNMSSVAGMLGSVSGAEFVSAQHGIIGLTRAASTEFSTTHVRVNAVMPGFIVTPMTEALIRRPDFAQRSDEILKRHSVGRLGEAEDVANAVIWLLSDQASFVNGVSLPVDGGYSVR